MKICKNAKSKNTIEKIERAENDLKKILNNILERKNCESLEIFLFSFPSHGQQNEVIARRQKTSSTSNWLPPPLMCVF